MTLTYEFDDEFFDYDVDLDNYLSTLTDAEYLNLAKRLYAKIDDKDFIKFLKEEYNISSIFDFDKSSEDAIDAAIYIAENVDLDILYDILSEDMKEYYEDDAHALFVEEKEISEDPFKGSGLKQSDFI